MADTEDGNTTITTFDTNEIQNPSVGTNKYATKKTAAHGMMDVALLMSNASQIKLLIDNQPGIALFSVLLVLLIVSMFLQILAGFFILGLGTMKVKVLSDHARAEKLNNAITGFIFFITIVNLFIGVLMKTS